MMRVATLLETRKTARPTSIVTTAEISTERRPTVWTAGREERLRRLRPFFKQIGNRWKHECFDAALSV
jgi:hypothetical protein